MKAAIKRFLCRVFLVVLLLCMTAPAALAADAVSVEVGSVTLNAASPYWKNGGGGSASDWNAFFDTGSPVPTLYLKDAVINTMNSYDEMVYADGDINLVLLGTNTLSYFETSAFSPAGIVADGDIVISDGTPGGTGKLIIDIDPAAFAFVADGILTEVGNMTIESGTIDITLFSLGIAYGLYAENDLYIHGGVTTVLSTGLGVSAVSVYYLNMTGGSITATAIGEFFDSHALLFYEMLVTGGYGRFVNLSNGYGALWDEPVAGEFRVIGGRMIFQSYNEALHFYTDEVINPTVTGRIYASTDFNGAGKFVWDSSKGILAGNESDESDFHYVELLGDGSPLPDTGDGSRPWLWVGIALAAALTAGAAAVWHKRRK